VIKRQMNGFFLKYCWAIKIETFTKNCFFVKSTPDHIFLQSSRNLSRVATCVTGTYLRAGWTFGKIPKFYASLTNALTSAYLLQQWFVHEHWHATATLKTVLQIRCLIHKAYLRFRHKFWEFSLVKYIQFCEVFTFEYQAWITMADIKQKY
jgi:hypothetical protein